ncbi:tautomerase family protein [Paucilactobacillus sp. N302-9]
MPYLRVRIASNKKKISKNKIASELTDLTTAILEKSREVVATDIQITDADSWFIGGQPLSKGNQTSFFMEIKITQSTNTRQQKADYIKAVFKLFQQNFANLSDTSYIVLHDVPSDSWGYGGKTQEYRYINN